MLTMRGVSQVGNKDAKTTRPPPVPPRPDKSIVADALAKTRKVPAPILPPGLKKEISSKISPENQSLQQEIKPTNKLPSPKLNGLSRVKSFIRDVMTDKKHSEEKRNKDEGDKKSKSQIPVPQTINISKQKQNDSSPTTNAHEESSKTHSVVKSFCGLINSDKSFDLDSKVERVRVVKSNSFAEKAVPVRKAPPPPISPKPTKKQIEEKLALNQNRNECFSFRKLSVSCEELNNPPRPVAFQSNFIKKIGSPLFVKKSVPPTLPSGKPPVLAKKKSLSSSPTGPSCNGFIFSERSASIDNINSNEKAKVLIEPEPLISDKDDFSEKLISEIISAKNDALLSNYQNRENVVEDETPRQHSFTNGFDKHVSSDTSATLQSDFSDEKVKCVNVSSLDTRISKGSPDNNSVCGSDSSNSATGKTILFINSDSGTYVDTNCEKTVVTNGHTKSEVNHRLNDIANHEFLISELQGMRRETFELKVNGVTNSVNCDNSSKSETKNLEKRPDYDDSKISPYSSCQIVIEDPYLVDDSGICLDENHLKSTDDSFCLSPTLLSRLKEQYYANLKMSSLQGLPPLPKSLSGFNVSEGPSHTTETHSQQNPQPPPVPARSAASFRYGVRGGSTSPPVTNGAPDPQRSSRKPTTLDAQLALLKREMLSLRQLDLSLLSQLWSLNESIHEFRQYMNSSGGPGGMGRDGGGGMGSEADGDMDDDVDDSSSGGEDSRHSPPRL